MSNDTGMTIIMSEPISWQCSLLGFLLLSHAEPALVPGIAHARNRTGDYWRSRPSSELSEFIELAQRDVEGSPWLEYRALAAGLVLAERDKAKRGVSNDH